MVGEICFMEIFICKEVSKSQAQCLGWQKIREAINRFYFEFYFVVFAVSPDFGEIFVVSEIDIGVQRRVQKIWRDVFAHDDICTFAKSSSEGSCACNKAIDCLSRIQKITKIL